MRYYTCGQVVGVIRCELVMRDGEHVSFHLVPAGLVAAQVKVHVVAQVHHSRPVSCRLGKQGMSASQGADPIPLSKRSDGR
jgi:hypothetical protein